MCDVLIDVNEVILLKCVMFRIRVKKGMVRYFQKLSPIILALPLCQIIFPITHIFISQIGRIDSNILLGKRPIFELCVDIWSTHSFSIN